MLRIRYNGVYLVSTNEGTSINNKTILAITYRSVTNYFYIYKVLSRVCTIPNLKAETITKKLLWVKINSNSKLNILNREFRMWWKIMIKLSSPKY